MINQTRTLTVEPDITIFEISGRLSLGNTLLSIETTIKKLIEGGARKLIVDLSQLAYIDSAAIGMLLGSNGLMDQAGGSMRIYRSPRSGGQILRNRPPGPYPHDLGRRRRRRPFLRRRRLNT